jgi:protein arginine kinase
VLLERNHLSQDFILHLNKNLILSDDNLVSAVVNDTDHLRLSVFDSGLSIRECTEKADSIDNELEKMLDYAVSFEFGYLNTEVNNLGTGMRASVMMHLPALVQANLIEKALKAVVQIGFTVNGFMGDDDHSLGSMYQISNQFTIGYSEEELVDKLQNLSLQIAGYERKAREEMYERKKTEVEDTVYRAYGLLTNCRLLSSNEAINNLSHLRMGIALGLIDLPTEVCSALIFLSQKSHIQKMIKDKDTAADDNLIDFTRAAYVKNTILDKKL